MILTDRGIEFEPQPQPLLRSKSILMHMNKRKKSKIPPPCQIKKIMFFFLRHIMEFWKHLLTKSRPKKRLIILITYYSQYSCKKNQEKNQKNHTVFIATKVEDILKGSLDQNPSPSPYVKIQIMGRKVCLRCKSKKLLGIVNKLFVFKSLLETSSNILPLHLSCP